MPSAEQDKKRIRIVRTALIPDPVREARCRKAPEVGPRILFFSGGSALRNLSQELLNYTHNSIHLITPFDSGGSSAKIREVFHMLSVGDLRNRLMALADKSVQGHPYVYDLFACRLPKDEDENKLWDRLKRMALGKDELISNIPDPMRKIIKSHLRFFLEAVPDGFNPRGASIGNLILTGGYVNYDRRIDTVIYLFSKLVEAKGIVRPIVNCDLHLGAVLEDGRQLFGQHLLTGKETAPPESPIAELFVCGDLTGKEVPLPKIRKKTRNLIMLAELICYPPGSFYTSLVANLLPEGVGRTIMKNNCPKVYVPNMGVDPESGGRGIYDCLLILLRYLKKDCPQGVDNRKLVDFVVIDSRRGNYPNVTDIGREMLKIKRLGIECLDTSLGDEGASPLADSKKLINVLVSLV